LTNGERERWHHMEKCNRRGKGERELITFLRTEGLQALSVEGPNQFPCRVKREKEKKKKSGEPLTCVIVQKVPGRRKAGKSKIGR